MLVCSHQEDYSKFSSHYVKQIIEAAQSDKFTVILHNCGAKLVHLPKILEANAEIYHFGALMDIGQALEVVEDNVILAGNLDPTQVFHSGSVAEVECRTQALMKLSAGHKNFIPSSGCDIPPQTPVDNLDAFYKVVRNYTD